VKEMDNITREVELLRSLIGDLREVTEGLKELTYHEKKFHYDFKTEEEMQTYLEELERKENENVTRDPLTMVIITIVGLVGLIIFLINLS
jgi:hypothetical protein